jgi:ATP-dependent Lon protease
MIAAITEINKIKQTKLDITIKRFLDLDIYAQRNTLINLLIYKDDDEVQYLCYILYDLIASENIEGLDKQNILESLPSKIKRYFKDVVKNTTKYTNDMMQKYDIHKITLEQQIYLMKANDIVKEKAIVKLKEIKSRSDETGLKAKQYLEGLLKIPFHVYREEPALKRMKEINKMFVKMFFIVDQLFPGYLENLKDFEKKDKYSLTEIINSVKKIEIFVNENIFKSIQVTISSQSNKQVLNIIHHINTIKKSKKQPRIQTTNKSKGDFITHIMEYLDNNKDNKTIVSDIFDTIHTEIPYSLNKTISDISNIKSNISQIDLTMNAIENVLDDSIYSHKHAKNQIMKIIAQWMNGEQTGYCFGFEGCPGIGKTSLAKKGLANCLKDDNGVSRPFAFIALGGSSNGSSLEGHGYTYMNSTWGKIVDILIETKCMNPIIYVDELDKVSKTENGKEIIGIFTHLIDQTQNDKFQDKYFSGIDIDLSKALFIFSYNDPEQIDKILLDRIHRIKFDNLTLTDKIVITRKFILPEINKKMGFENIVQITDDVIEYIINTYTTEPGVRKLKEIFFDLFGEINLAILKSNFNTYDIETPIVITKETVDNKYLTKYKKITEKKIHSRSEVGIINGLWANALANGGIIPIQARFFPSSTFLDLKLTGLQGDVMKESMNVAKTLAWNLTDSNIKKQLIRMFDETKDQGIHVHCPEGSISKDGPSAGAAITSALYSLFNNKPIKNDVAITGEICLNGEITAIGGLENKLNGGIRSGITKFLYPKSNDKDFNEWKNKDKNLEYCKTIEFIEVSHINDVFKHIFCSNSV